MVSRQDSGHRSYALLPEIEGFTLEDITLDSSNTTKPPEDREDARAAMSSTDLNDEIPCDVAFTYDDEFDDTCPLSAFVLETLAFLADNCAVVVEQWKGQTPVT